MTALINSAEVWDMLDDEFLGLYDSAFTCDVASGTGWGGYLRLTLTDPDGEPSRSMTFWSVGADDPEEVAIKCMRDAAAWLAESGVTPMPVPDWVAL